MESKALSFRVNIQRDPLYVWAGMIELYFILRCKAGYQFWLVQGKEDVLTALHGLSGFVGKRGEIEWFLCMRYSYASP